ncbi:MAG: ribonuclease Y [Clostridiales bacterium]|nr:ribonuclease Y [Clostridiales bacterium]
MKIKEGGVIILWYAIEAVLALLLIAVAFYFGIQYRKKVAEAQIGQAETKAREIVDDALKTADAKKREALIEAKEESMKLRNDVDKEIKERRSEVQKQEKRLVQKEEALDRKNEQLERKDNQMNRKLEEIERKNQEISQIHEKKIAELEKISGLTTDQAKEVLIRSIEDDVKHDVAVMIKENETRAKEESTKKAREILTGAIQRCAADHVAETTVSVVPLPNDEMKGRIIGREGRNIRALETMTGIDLIIDDTPEAVILSGFDGVRREIARIALEKLIVDGRIHPARIEEMVGKATKEVETKIREEGEAATFDTNVHGLHPELIRLLGKLRYRTSYGQNVLKHSIEVSHLAGLMAAELGLDVRMAKRAGLLHDIGKAVDHEMEGSHVMLGAQLLKKYHESRVVINAVEAHHGDVEPESEIAVLVQAADSVSAARPGARRETLENYITRMEKLESIANDFKGVEKTFAIQAGRELRLIVTPEQVNDDEMVILARDVAKRIENELEYPGQIKVNIIRETRAVEYAK